MTLTKAVLTASLAGPMLTLIVATLDPEVVMVLPPVPEVPPVPPPKSEPPPPHPASSAAIKPGRTKRFTVRMAPSLLNVG